MHGMTNIQTKDKASAQILEGPQARSRRNDRVIPITKRTCSKSTVNPRCSCSQEVRVFHVRDILSTQLLSPSLDLFLSEALGRDPSSLLPVLVDQPPGPDEDDCSFDGHADGYGCDTGLVARGSLGCKSESVSGPNRIRHD